MRKAVDVGDWLGRSVVAEGVSPVRIQLLIFGESLELVGAGRHRSAYRRLTRRTGVASKSTSTCFERRAGITQKRGDSSNSSK